MFPPDKVAIPISVRSQRHVRAENPTSRHTPLEEGRRGL
jgi:hypothetical protein